MISHVVEMNVFVKFIYMKKILTVENLHLFTGFALVIAGLISYQQEGVGMMLSWTIFGAMYLSMSDIGEDKMTAEEIASFKHKIRVTAAYLGAILAVWLLITFL